MGRLHLSVAAEGCSWLHRIKAPFACGKICDDTAPAAKALFYFAPAFGVCIDACRIGLPCFKQHVFHRRTCPVDHEALDTDTLARRIGACDVPSQLFAVDIKASGPRREADVNIGPSGLGGGFFKVFGRVAHINSPPACFQRASNGGRAGRYQNDKQSYRAESLRSYQALP